MNYWAVIRQALTISGSRLVALSMVSVDLMILGRFSMSETADFALAVQYSQLFIVLALALTVGVNIAFNLRRAASESLARSISGYALFVGVGLFLISVPVGCYVDMTENARWSYFVLALGILPTTAYVALCAMVETSGGASWVFKLTAGAAVANAMLDFLFIRLGLGSPAVAVAVATTAVRLLLLACMIQGCVTKYRIGIAPIADRAEWMNLFSYGRSEAVVGLIFTGGMSLLFAYAQARSQEKAVALLAIGINFLNIASVLYVGMTRAVANAASVSTQRILVDMRGLACFGLLYVAAGSVALYAASPLFSWLYLGAHSAELLRIFFVAIWVVAFDGAAMLFITLLRLLDWRTGPPLLRLALILVGVPLAVGAFDPSTIQPVFKGLLAGNIVAAISSGMLLLYAVSTQIRK